MTEPRPADPGEKRRRRWRRLVPVSVVLMAFIAVEAVLQEVDRADEQAVMRDRIDDPLRGWALRPGYRGLVTEENDVMEAINRDAMRDREHPLQTPPSTVRIAILGDSYMQAQNLPFERSITPLLERHLETCLAPQGRHAEVLNFGVSGYGTGQELLTYQHHAVRYQPDVVVLAIYTGNDIFDNHPDLREPTLRPIPFFTLESGQPVWHPAPEPLADDIPWYHRVRFAITRRSILASRAWDVYAQLRAPFVAPQVVEIHGAFEREAPENIYAPPRSERFDAAWRLTEALVIELARQVAAHGAEFWVVTLANADQIAPDLAVRRAVEVRQGVNSLSYPDDRFRELARTHGIPIVTLAEPLAAYAARTGEWLNGGYNGAFPRGTGHWNETAHRLAADIVGDRLCAGSTRLTQ